MADIQKVLRRLLEELDKEDKDELLESLKGRKLTSEELLSAIRELPPEARAEVREALADVKKEVDEEEDEEDDKKKSKKKDEDEEEEDGDGKKKKSKTRTRPGRKAGRAYSWWIDEKTGEVVHLDIARVYSGPDEPDEVEMLPVNDEDDEDDEDEEEAV